MRLADFILANVEPILVEWEDFAQHLARTLNDSATDPATLRDHAEDILRDGFGHEVRSNRRAAD